MTFPRTERASSEEPRWKACASIGTRQELNAANINLPIAFLTGHGDIPMSVRAMKAGAVEFLTKPFREQDLFDAAQTALERDRVNREDEKLLSTLRHREPR